MTADASDATKKCVFAIDPKAINADNLTDFWTGVGTDTCAKMNQHVIDLNKSLLAKHVHLEAVLKALRDHILEQLRSIRDQGARSNAFASDIIAKKRELARLQEENSRLIQVVDELQTLRTLNRSQCDAKKATLRNDLKLCAVSWLF
jgi:hypothetical protein